jgi:hypothetical protein
MLKMLAEGPAFTAGFDRDLFGVPGEGWQLECSQKHQKGIEWARLDRIDGDAGHDATSARSMS